MVHDGDGLAGADARSGAAIDFRRGIKVVVIDDGRPAVVADLDQAPKRHSVAFAVADFEIADVVDFHAVFGRGLEVDLPVAILKEEVIDINRSQIRLQGRINVLKLDLLSFGFFLIDIDKKFLLGNAEAAEESE